MIRRCSDSALSHMVRSDGCSPHLMIQGFVLEAGTVLGLESVRHSSYYLRQSISLTIVVPGDNTLYINFYIFANIWWFAA